MKPLRRYQRATLYLRDGGIMVEAWEVEMFNNIVIYFDEKGNEHTAQMRDINEVVCYVDNPKVIEGSKLRRLHAKE